MQKRAQEVARYVLPLATPAHLYHTVNGLTLLRYHVLANQPDVPAEVRYIVDRMVAEVLAVDPYFLGAPEHPARSAAARRRGDAGGAGAGRRGARRSAQLRNEADASCEAFDAALGDRTTAAWSATTPMPSASWPRRCARCSASTADELSDEDALAQVLDPTRNPYLGHPLFLGMQLQADADDEPRAVHLAKADQLAPRMRRTSGTAAPLSSQPAPAGCNSARAGRDRALGDRAEPGRAGRVRRDDPRALDAQERAARSPACRRRWRLYLLPNSAPDPLLRERHPARLLLEVGQAALLRRAAGDLRDGGREVAQVRERLPTIGRYVDGPPCVMRSRAGTDADLPRGRALLRHPRLARLPVRDAGRRAGDVSRRR